ncbi:hypothetical protein KKI24_13000 [bacterium]|nr:hypothetical protein [bacterium]
MDNTAEKPQQNYWEAPEFKVASLAIRDFKGIEIFEYKFNESGKLVVCGDHGSAKTSVIDAARCLFYGQRAFSQIDEPVRQGQKRLRIEAVIEGTGKLNGFEIGNRLRVTLTKSRAGSPQYKIEDLDNDGAVQKNPKAILDELRAMWLDPYEFLNLLYEKKTTALGAKKQAEYVCQSAGLDLTPFTLRAEELAEQYTIENSQVTRTNGVLADLDVPQDDWPAERLDPESIRQEIERLNNHVRLNEKKQQTIVTAQAAVTSRIDSVQVIKENLERLTQEHLKQTEAHQAAQEKYSAHCQAADKFKNENPPKEWPGTQDIDEKIRVLMEEQKRKLVFEAEERAVKEKLVEMNNAGELVKKDAAAALEKLTDKQTEIVSVMEQINIGDLQIEQLKTELEKIETVNQPEPWRGERDPDGKMFPGVYLTAKMRSVTKNNEFVTSREKYLQAQAERDLAVTALEKVKQAQKQNEVEKMKKIADTDLKVRYLTVDENRLYVELPGKPKVSLNDLNHAAQIGICTEILMANSKSPLKLVVIKEGYGCLPEAQRAIFDAAFRWGFNVILETFVYTDDGDVVYMQDGHMVDAEQALKRIETPGKNKDETVIGWDLASGPDQTVSINSNMDLG